MKRNSLTPKLFILNVWMWFTNFIATRNVLALHLVVWGDPRIPADLRNFLGIERWLLLSLPQKKHIREAKHSVMKYAHKLAMLLLVIVLLAMLLSDIVLGFHGTMIWVYSSIVVISLSASFLKPRMIHLGFASVGSSLFFFLVTNFGVWASASRIREVWFYWSKT